MSEALHNTQFLTVIVIGLSMLGIFAYWLCTGARRRR